MMLKWRQWRPPALVLAAVLIAAAAVSTHAMPLAERTEQCGGCHGEDGNSRMEKIPSLAGQPEFFTANQLILMREGVRKVEAMEPFVKDLTDEDITALAQHYARLAPKRSDEAVDAALAKRGEQVAATRHCASCHRPDFSGQEQMPRIAKQRIDYMIDALKAYRDNTRSGADTAMSAAVYGLSDGELEALAHYAASR